MSYTTYHLCMNIKGAILNAKQLKTLATSYTKKMSEFFRL